MRRHPRRVEEKLDSIRWLRVLNHTWEGFPRRMKMALFKPALSHRVTIIRKAAEHVLEDIHLLT